MKKGFFERRPPSGASISTEKVYEDTGTEKNYGELTWSDKQILCDTLQNSLDAETRMFISRIESEYVVDSGDNLSRASENPEWQSAYLNMLNSLYVLSYRASDLDVKEKRKLIERIHEEAENLGVKLHEVNFESFKQSERPAIPQLMYAVRDQESGKIIRGLSRDELTSPPYNNGEQYPLFEWSVNDAGSGYDVTKSVLYLPTKTDERFSRGVFGEGLKVNQAAIARVPGVSLRIHSQYEEESGQPVAWVRHVETEDNMVVQRGINVRHPVAPNTGSGTTIRFVEQRPENEEFKTVLDPRTTPVESVAAEFGKTIFTYPLGIQESGFAYPGVALQPTPNQYLQGLSIGTSRERLLFSYDFHNRSVIAGRDRNHLNNDVVKNEVIQFWEHVQNPKLHQELLKRLLFESSPGHTPERSVLFNACTRLLESSPTAEDQLLLLEFIESLKLRQDVPNYIAWQGDGKVSQIDAQKNNVVQLELSCSLKEQELMLKALMKLAPHIDFLQIPIDVAPEVEQVKDTGAERELTAQEKEFTKDLSSLFVDVEFECAEMMRAFEQGNGTRPINPNITYEIRRWQKEISFSVEAKDNLRNITCFLPGDGTDLEITPDLSNPDTYIKVRAKVIVLYLATIMLGKGQFSSYYREYAEYAQMAAQSLLDTSNEQEPFLVGSLNELRGKAKMLMGEQLKGIRSKIEREELEDLVMKFNDEAARLSCTPERLLEIGRWCTDGHENVKGSSTLLSKVLHRVIVRDGQAVFVVVDETEGIVLKNIELTTTNKIGDWSGYPIFQISDDRSIVSVPTHNKATLSRQYTDSNRETHAVCNDTVVIINTLYTTTSESVGASRTIIIDNGCIIVDSMEAAEYLESYEYSPVPQERAKQDMSIQTGLMKSPITLEYISTHWSDPERIFQDLGQNHMDAGGMEARYLVLKNNERVWVDKKDLGDSQIVGYELSDRGLGYSPTGISNMGHTRKRNPFLTGKNGEGLKLAAASAKKNGFDIKFSSFGENNDGTRVVWEADVLTLDEPYTHGGKTKYAKRLGFNVKTQPAETLAERSSVTSLKLPVNADSQSSKKWDEWVSCIDPRKKDAWGNEGIERILITKEIPKDSSDTVGPVTAIYNRPGAIFENGMLVRTDSQDERKFTLGWNFPSITSTRERTHINLDMARSYIQYFFQHTTDERAVTHLLKSIQTHQIDTYHIGYSDDEFNEITKLAERNLEKSDVDASWALSEAIEYPSLKLFQTIAKQLYPNKVLFSYEHAKRYKISMGGSMRHIRKEDRINVSAADYHKLRAIFPTMETYLEDVRSSRIDIDPESLSPLRDMVGTEISEVADAITRISQDPERRPLLQHILDKSSVTMDDLHSRLKALHPKSSAGTINDVFIMADDSNADGLASDGIGLRISLLDSNYPNEWGRLFGVLDHELAHKMLGANDYSEEFILMLFLLAQDSLESKSYV